MSLQNWQVKDWCSHRGDAGGGAHWCGANGTQPLSKAFPLDNTTVSAAAAQYMRQAYFATVSWTDHNLGRILDAFEATPFRDDAVLALWGDHGWHLGDNDQWAKMTNFEHATKIPLLLGCGGSHCSGRSPALVEAIDIMPTILEEAGLPIRPCPFHTAASRQVGICTEGRSLSSLLREPQAPQGEDAASYSQFPRPEHPERHPDLQCQAEGKPRETCPNKMGYSIRTEAYRYTAWVGFHKCSNSSCPAALADWNTVYGEELYNHTCAVSSCKATFDTETVNIAGFPESTAIKAKLHAQLKAFNTKGLAAPAPA